MRNISVLDDIAKRLINFLFHAKFLLIEEMGSGESRFITLRLPQLARGERIEDVQFSISLSRFGFCRFQTGAFGSRGYARAIGASGGARVCHY